MPRSCSCRCWSAPRDAVKSSGRWRACRPSLCCARSTRCSSSARCAPSWCSVVRCTCTRRGTEDDRRRAGDRDRRDVLFGQRARRAAPPGVSVVTASSVLGEVARRCRADCHDRRDPRSHMGDGVAHRDRDHRIREVRRSTPPARGRAPRKCPAHGRARSVCRDPRCRSSRGRAAAPVGLSEIDVIVFVVLAALAAQDTSALARRLARADSAFAAGDAGTAAREYAAALAVDSENSHATYRLADLSRRSDPARALGLFRRYVALEPSDPWGFIALGDALARSGRYGDALRSYDDALRVAPGERDAVIGRLRVLARAGHTDAAARGYRQWLDANPSDAEAWGELGRQRLRQGRERDAALAFERAEALAPDPSVARRLAVARAAAAAAITPLASGTHASDGNTTLRLGGTGELASWGPLRLGLTASRTAIEDGVTTTGRQDLTLGAAWRPGAAWQVQASGGASRLDAALGRSATILPTGQLRARWRVPGGGPIVDLRARRDVLDATPLLAANRVLRTELGATVELPVGRVFKLRGIGRTVALSDSAEVNHRTTLAGMVAVPVTPSVEVSAQFHTIRFAHPTTAGYFAPRLVQVAQAGAAIGPWGRALRLYSLIVVPLAVGRDLRLEFDGEQSAFANELATTGGAQWRYVSVAMSLRWALD